MPYTFVADGFHTKNLVADFLPEKSNFRQKTITLRFFEPPWGLGATHDVYLRLIRERVMDFLLVLTELFSLGVTAEALRANID